MTLLEAIMTGEDLERDGRIIVNHIGEATYIDIQRASIKELEEVIRYRKWIEKIWAE